MLPAVDLLDDRVEHRVRRLQAGQVGARLEPALQPVVALTSHGPALRDRRQDRLVLVLAALPAIGPVQGRQIPAGRHATLSAGWPEAFTDPRVGPRRNPLRTAPAAAASAVSTRSEACSRSSSATSTCARSDRASAGSASPARYWARRVLDAAVREHGQARGRTPPPSCPARVEAAAEQPLGFRPFRPTLKLHHPTISSRSVFVLARGQSPVGDGPVHVAGLVPPSGLVEDRRQSDGRPRGPGVVHGGQSGTPPRPPADAPGSPATNPWWSRRRRRARPGRWPPRPCGAHRCRPRARSGRRPLRSVRGSGASVGDMC